MREESFKLVYLQIYDINMRHRSQSVKKNILSQCVTPSTDDNNSYFQTPPLFKFHYKKSRQVHLQPNPLIISTQTDLSELLQLILFEDFQFQDLQDYFYFSFTKVFSLSDFHYIIYECIKDYLQKIRSSLYQNLNDLFDYRKLQQSAYVQKELFKKFSQNSEKYLQIVNLLNKSFEIMDSKSKELQKVVNSYANVVNNQNQVNCSELQRTLFSQVVLKDQAINIVLDNLTDALTNNKFYSDCYKNTIIKLRKLNSLRIYKNKIPLTLIFQETFQKQKNRQLFEQVEQYNLQPQKIQETTKIEIQIKHHHIDQKENPDNYQKCKSIQTNFEQSSKKKNKKNKLNSTKKQKIDDVKIFEEKLEEDYTQMDGKSKITIDWPVNWLQALRSKLQEIKAIY